MSGGLHDLDITSAALLIQSKSLSPVDLTEALLARIQELDPQLNAFITVTAERALDDARKAEAEIAAGHYRGPLHGIPIAYKDIFATAGVPTTGHSRLLASNVPERDATLVARLRYAGTVLLGKLSTHEFAFGGPSFDLPSPPARNPWNTARFTGGSSSGSGAAIAAGLCLGSVGSDSAGSIRTPAAMCGICGLKPTFGRVSRAGALPMSYSLDHCGPMARTSRDVALLLTAMAGFDPTDPASVDEPVPDFLAGLTHGIDGLRIGWVTQFYESDAMASDDQRLAMSKARDVLEGLGAEINDVQLSPLMDYHAACIIIAFSEAFAVHASDLRERPQMFGESARDRATLAAFFSAADYVHAQRLRRRLTAEIDAALKNHDVLVTAGAWGEAPPIEDVQKFGLYREPYPTSPFSLVGLPAIALPCGFGASGLPLGMQVVGRALDEATILRVAHAYEHATDWHTRRPDLPMSGAGVSSIDIGPNRGAPFRG